MAFIEQPAQCQMCGRQTLHRQQRPNHILHFLVTMFTCGAWIVVWALISMSQSPWLCSICGTKQGASIVTGGPTSATSSPVSLGMSPKGIAVLGVVLVLVYMATQVMDWFVTRFGK